MKVALVTGASGFIGRHFSEFLARRGWAVMACDVRYPIGPVDALDIFRDKRAWTNPHLIVHCAYHVGGRKSIDGDKSALVKNLQLDTALFQYAERTKSRVLYLSSSSVYPLDWQIKPTKYQPHLVKLTEDSISGWSGFNPDADYGWAKLTGERLASNAQAMGVPVHIIRPFSGFGLDQSLDYPFTSFLKRAREHQDPFEIWGDPESLRDWIHVSDLVAGALAIVDADCQEPVNICTGIGTSFRDLAGMCMKAYGYEAEIKSNMDAPQGVFARVGDPTKFFEFYQPQKTLEEVIWISRSLGTTAAASTCRS